ncbi:ABC-type nitrate/sulfonate/bicarbonate transport system, periplasmic component [Lachnospiraceae bacterium JC7]|nr:ABC-type nitrate/sulfonate/bicarbonate transport system, periplasmic component [Lachnospiraceae bacterium JC7]
MIRKPISVLLLAAMTLSFAACGAPEVPAGKDTVETAGTSVESTAMTAEKEVSKETTATEAAEEQSEKPEVSEIHWARANSGNILVTVAKQQGYFAEYGINIIEDPVDSAGAALTALQTEQVDVTSNQGTNGPLGFIGKGSDFTIVGGYMLKGMYIVGRKDKEYKDVTSLKGSRFAYNGIHAVTGMALLDAGIDPTSEVEWLPYDTNSDRLAAVIAGEADYAVLSGDQLLTVANNPDIEIKAWLDDLVPNYGCCRMNMNTSFVKKNPVTTKLLLKALIRAEQWYLSHKEECVKILAKEIDADEDYVASYLLNENYISSVDPCKKAVLKTWDAMISMGLIDKDEAAKINIEDHINTELYKEALDECVQEFHDEDPEFYDGRIAFFEENNNL